MPRSDVRQARRTWGLDLYSVAREQAYREAAAKAGLPVAEWARRELDAASGFHRAGRRTTSTLTPHIPDDWSQEFMYALLDHIPYRTIALLQRHGIHDLEQLCAMTVRDLRALPGVGRETVTNCQLGLAALGRALTGPPLDVPAEPVERQLSQRDKDVLAASTAGARPKDLAEQFKLSRQRIHQILRRGRGLTTDDGPTPAP